MQTSSIQSATIVRRCAAAAACWTAAAISVAAEAPVAVVAEH